MTHYQIWNHTDDIITPSGAQFTAAEWGAMYPWALIPGVKMVITKPPINGGVALVFDDFIEEFAYLGCQFTDDMTDQEKLDAISLFQVTPPELGPSVEERTAAALEFLALSALPDVE